jgi:ribosomal protein L11 methyltransferase
VKNILSKNWQVIKVKVPVLMEEPVGEIMRNLRPGKGLQTEENADFIEYIQYLPEELNWSEIRLQLEKDLQGLDQFFAPFEWIIETEIIEEENWAENWKENFKPLRIGSHFVICPSWEKVELHTDDILITLDPGAAFGTGLHETTNLCLQTLEELGPGNQQKMLDLGCGSGILAIGAHLLGYKVHAADIDPYAVTITEENCTVNQITLEGVYQSDLLETLAKIEGNEKFDLIVANILLPEVLRLMDQITTHLRPGGKLVVSGLIDQQAKQVCEKMAENGLEFIKQLSLNEWIAIIGKN